MVFSNEMCLCKGMAKQIDRPAVSAGCSAASWSAARLENGLRVLEESEEGFGVSGFLEVAVVHTPD